ncbi:MAG: hypothetical protein L3K04_00675 [Thermoplasmata archaeon]|nr:hypothetical protein [Thermoplasmata archaeon]MCI4340870.1 hypothetical protein [Thermoplasmata archaeon]
MSVGILVPDTGILLAIGFGPQDPKSAMAASALSRAVAAGVKVVAPPSVDVERVRKLNLLDQVYEDLQVVTSAIPIENGSPAALEGAEQLLMAVRAKKGYPRLLFLDAIEEEVSRAVTSNPTAPLRNVFAYVAASALHWKESAKLASCPSAVEFLNWPQPDYTPLNPEIREVNGPDLAHLRACQEIGDKEGVSVAFLILERAMYAHKAEIEARFPRVKVVKPAFLNRYLEKS